MEISGKGPTISLGAYLERINNPAQARRNKASTQRTAAAAQDTVKLSAEAKEVQQAMQTLKAMPSVRSEKVSAIKLQIDRGTYRVNGDRIAFQMLSESFDNNRILSGFQTEA